MCEFYAAAVFPRLGELDIAVCEETVLGMLAQLPQLCREDPRFWDRLSNLAFVKTANGKLARPWEVIHTHSLSHTHTHTHTHTHIASTVSLSARVVDVLE